MKTVIIPGTHEDGSTEDIEVSILEENDLVSVIIELSTVASLDLSPLSSLTGLKQLNICTNFSLESLDLSPLSSLTELRKLDISGNTSLNR